MPDPSAEPRPRCPSRGERCSLCGEPATHKVGEEIPWDDPDPDRHNLTAYVCCTHFRLILGWAVRCGRPTSAPETWPCPCCRGLGETPGGAVEFRTDSDGMLLAVGYRQGSPCRLCRCRGRVLVLPLPDGEATP